MGNRRDALALGAVLDSNAGDETSARMLSLVTTRMLSSTSHQRVDTGGHVHTPLKIGALVSHGHRAAIWCADGERRIGDQ